MKQKNILSLLWISVLMNMIYADILSLMDSTSPIRQIMEGSDIPAGGLLAGAILMETPVLMIILSQILSNKINRWVTLLICAVNILAVVKGGHGSYYILFASIEIAMMIAIVIIAWRKSENEASNPAP